ncbi:MAG: cupin domain-containing protein [Halioglobus sp.]
MKSTFITLAALGIACSFTHIALAQNPDKHTGFVNLEPADLEFEMIPGITGASQATLLGDPAKKGVYVMRYRIPAGQLVPPHHHDQDRHITVIAGTWAFGTGDSNECENTVPMPPGSYVFHPKDAVHFDGSCTSVPIEVQVIGVGPVQTIWLSEK